MAQMQQQQNADAIETNIAQAPSQILNGQAPNPNLQVHRRGPNTKRARDGKPIAPNPPLQPHQAPSLTAHLLATCSRPFIQATQQPFLSHAGCGSLAAGPLSQWLVQDAHYSRGYIRFVGQLLAKIRLPQTQNSQFHPMYRTMDLLISALNNMRREMQFFEITATKYGLVLGQEGPTPITRSLLDLFMSASGSSSSLLEGMVVLWGTEHVCCVYRCMTDVELTKTVLPLRLAVRFLLQCLPLDALQRITHRRPSPSAHSQLDVPRILQIRRCNTRPSRRARQHYNYPRRKGRNDAL
jgi:hypothetical protein